MPPLKKTKQTKKPVSQQDLNTYLSDGQQFAPQQAALVHSGRKVATVTRKCPPPHTLKPLG